MVRREWRGEERLRQPEFGSDWRNRSFDLPTVDAIPKTNIQQQQTHTNQLKQIN